MDLQGNFTAKLQQFQEGSKNVTIMMPMIANFPGNQQQQFYVPVTVMIPNMQLSQPAMMPNVNSHQPPRRHSVSCSSTSSSGSDPNLMDSFRQFQWVNSTVNDFKKGNRPCKYVDYKVPRKKPVLPSPNDLMIMNQAFEENKTPDSETRQKIAKAIGKTSKWVQVWFQNRRQLMKRRHSMALNSGGCKGDVKDNSNASLGQSSTELETLKMKKDLADAESPSSSSLHQILHAISIINP